jgi:hypothetical protein
MAEIDLKSYTTRAAELEMAIYMQKKLMTAHKTVIDEQRPIMPKKQTIEEPRSPQYYSSSSYQANGGFYFFIGCMVLIGILGLPLLYYGKVLVALICIGVGILGGICIYTEVDNKRQADEQAQIDMNRYQKAKEEYPALVEQYKRKLASIEETYSEEFKTYEQNLFKYNDKSFSVMEQHTTALSSLEVALQMHYDENVIFPKYRNMIAITTINEYLLSGRCFELEGPNGAYNLYEMELRQNIIIGQLSTVIDNLEQIRNNQFSLYRELIHTNESVNQIIYELRDLGKTSKLNAYFSGVAAKAAISPKIIKGIIH